MVLNASKISIIAAFVFSLLLIFLNQDAKGINDLDIILCGKKGNQYFISSTPFITKGAYLYADLLIKSIENPWPVWPNGKPYTEKELKLAIVKNVILTSPIRLRYEISHSIPPADSIWLVWLDKMRKYPKVLRMINDVRFSVFLCGPGMLDSPVIKKFIDRLNKKHGYVFNPLSDKIILAALKLHGLKEEEIKSKLILYDDDSSKSSKKEIINKNNELNEKHYENNNFISKETTSESSRFNDAQKPLILNESEFEEFKSEKSFESDYEKTPPFKEQNLNSISIPVSSSVDEKIEVPKKYIQNKNNPEDLRISSIARNKHIVENDENNSIDNFKKPDLSLEEEFNSDIKELPEIEDFVYTKKHSKIGNNIKNSSFQNFDLNKNFYVESNTQDPSKIEAGDNTNSDSYMSEEITIGENGKTVTENHNILDPQSFKIELPKNMYDDISEENSNKYIENETTEESKTFEDSKENNIESNDNEDINNKNVEDNKEDNIKVFDYENNKDINNEDNNENNEINNINHKEDEVNGEDDDYEDDDYEDDDYENDEEYNQYLDYKDHFLQNKDEMADYFSTKPKKERILVPDYPIGNSEKVPKAHLQDVTSTFNDLLNALKTNKISTKNIAFGIPSLNLRLSSKSKAIDFKERTVRKWKAQQLDGVLKSIPIFGAGKIDQTHSDELIDEETSKIKAPKRELSLVQLDFNSAIKSHDKNEGGYHWMQRNLIAIRTTSGFQDILIKTALKGLETITSIQCSSILGKSVSSKEVRECIVAYFGSIKYGQNSAYGSLVDENDEDKSIQGYEIIKNIGYPNENKDNEYDLSEKDEADEIIRKNLSLSKKNQISSEEFIKDKKNDESNKINPNFLNEIQKDEEIKSIEDGAEDFESDQSAKSEEGDDQKTENTPILPNSDKTKTNIENYKEMNTDFQFQPQENQKEQSPEYEYTADGSINKDGSEFLNEHHDPEFVDRTLEELAYNVTETYKNIVESMRIVSKDVESYTNSYQEFLKTVLIWAGIAGKALIHSGKNLSGIFKSNKRKLIYYYCREEFYIYSAIYTYTEALIKILNSFIEIKEILNNVKELLKKSFETRIYYHDVSELIDKYQMAKNEFSLTYDTNLKQFCGDTPVYDCLGIMRNDFYRRNEKFHSFISRSASTKRSLSKLLKLFDIKIDPKSTFTMNDGITREDINRYLLVKEYGSKKIPLFGKNIDTKFLKKEIKADKENANQMIETLLNKYQVEKKEVEKNEIVKKKIKSEEGCSKCYSESSE